MVYQAGRDDLIARYKVPLDEYPKRCVEQVANWHQELESYKRGERIEVKPSREYASTIMNAIWTGEPSVVYGNVRNDGLIDNLPQGAAWKWLAWWTPTAFSRPK
jgi:alpha-galactosidase